MRTYEEIHQMVKENVSWSEPYRKLKFVYENKNWQQVKPDYDLFNDYSQIDSLCTSGQLVHDSICIADYSFWTAMKQAKPTEDVYQFIDYATQSLKTSIHDFHFNFDHILNFIDFIGGMVL